MGLGGVAIAVPPYVIHPKTAVLGRAGGGYYAFYRIGNCFLLYVSKFRI